MQRLMLVITFAAIITLTGFPEGGKAPILWDTTWPDTQKTQMIIALHQGFNAGFALLAERDLLPYLTRMGVETANSFLKAYVSYRPDTKDTEFVLYAIDFMDDYFTYNKAPTLSEAFEKLLIRWHDLTK